MDLSGVMKDLSGKDILNGDKEPLTYSNMCIHVLLLADQEKEEYVLKVKKFKLAQKLAANAKKAELTLDEKELIKTQLTKFCGPLMVGLVVEKIYGEV